MATASTDAGRRAGEACALGVLATGRGDEGNSTGGSGGGMTCRGFETFPVRRTGFGGGGGGTVRRCCGSGGGRRAGGGWLGGNNTPGNRCAIPSAIVRCAWRRAGRSSGRLTRRGCGGAGTCPYRAECSSSCRTRCRFASCCFLFNHDTNALNTQITKKISPKMIFGRSMSVSARMRGAGLKYQNPMNNHHGHENPNDETRMTNQ